MRKTVSLLMVLVSMVLAVDYVQAQSQDQSELGGKKWAGTRLVTRPSRLVTKADLEVTRVADGQVEGVLQMETDGKQTLINFQCPLERSPAGLPIFKFKSSSGLEYECEMQTDGRMIVSRPGLLGLDPGMGMRPEPFFLNPVR
jgi:hypothetical protein